MKKSISLLLIFSLILSIFALVGCSEKKEEKDALTVHVVVASTFGDKSFNDSAQIGADRLKTKFQLNVNYTECNRDGAYKQHIIDAAENADIVALIGWQFYEVTEIATEYPSVKFIWMDNEAENIENIPNLACVMYDQKESGFLAGYLAAKMSTSGIIGAVGGENSNIVNEFFTGYKMGAEYANPDVKCLNRYANGYDDTEKAKECAEKLHQKGADVIFQLAGKAGVGIFDAAKENGFYVIATDQDQKIATPEYDDVIVASVKKEIGNAIYDIVKDLVISELWEGGKVYTFGLSKDYISLSYGDRNSTQQISNDIKLEMKNIADKIISKDIDLGIETQEVKDDKDKNNTKTKDKKDEE